MTELVEVTADEESVLHVVFVHGLDGDARRSWSAKRRDSFWPEWLGRDIEGLSVWSLGYDAASSRWLGHAMPIQDRAINLLALLESQGIGQRPLCFVTHSMGGLVVKEMLLHAADGRADYTEFATATRGVVFLATPHTGSDIVTKAVVKALAVVHRKTPAVNALERNSAHLRQLNTRYRNWAAGPTTDIKHKIFYETQSTKGVQVVDAGSADPAIPGQTPIPVDANHIDICKPFAPSELVYGQVKRFITGIITALQADPDDPGKQETPRQYHLDDTLRDAGSEPPVHAVNNSRGVQAGNNNTQHNYNTVTQAPLPAIESVPAVPDLSRIPLDTALFVGRSDELDQLDEVLSESGRATVVAVHGLGGVGKSTLAARFAHLHAVRFGFRWWITADSPTAIDTGLAELAKTLQPATRELPVEQRSAMGIRWLATHENWLLVLDNVTSPQDVVSLLERVRTGTIVITSRQRSGWRAVETVPLDVLTDDEAVRLLTRIVQSEWPEADLAGADRLCRELGWLPLAVEQAGAYLAQNRISPTAYLDLLARLPARMFIATAEGGDAQRTMARVWHVTLDRLAGTSAAGRVLRLVAWFAPDGIPRALLTGEIGEPELSETLGRLAAYNMITLTADTLSVHRLVQAVTRTPDPTDPHRQPADIALARENATTILANIVSRLDPSSPTSWPYYRLVLPHARALLDHSTPDMDTTYSSLLLNNLGRYLEKQGNVSTAATYHTRATATHERLLGRDHPNTLASRANLASTYQAAGDLRQAVQLLEATLADSERVLGQDDPRTLAVRNNLAYAYREVGDSGRSHALFEATLADFERVLGHDDPRTLNSRNNLAGTYHEVGDLGRAIPLYETALADYERVMGFDDPETLSSRNDLAEAYEAVGDLERAISLHEVTLADRERVLGPDHPETLTSRNNLANVYRAAGDLERAIPMLEGTLADSERVLGLDHPHTLNSWSHLASAYQFAGDLERAIPIFEATLADSERVLGLDHPHTLAVRNNLASTYASAGDLERAIPMLEGTLADSERVLGPDHPHTLSMRNNLAFAYESAGDLERAIPMYEANLADLERILGPDHPHTQSTRNKLAAATGDLSDPGHVISLPRPNCDDRQG